MATPKFRKMIDLEHLKNLLGSEEMAARFLDIFEQQAPEQLRSIRSGTESGDWKAASIAAHSLKSQLRYLGLNDEAALAAELEQSTESGQINWPTLTDLEQRLLPLFKS